MNYRIVNHRIEVEDPDTHVFNDYCEEVSITKVITDLITGEKTVEIIIYATPSPVTVSLPKSKLNRRVLPILIGYGLKVVDDIEQCKFVLRVLFESEANALHSYTHNKLGFCKVDGTDTFLLNNPIGISDPLKSASVYTEPELTEPKGSLSSWKSFIDAEVLGNTNLELALAIGSLAPVSHLLRADGYIDIVPIVALVGNSSTGKTCTLRLCGSLWHSPGLLMGVNCTQNAFFQQISALGFPALVDDTSHAADWDFSKIIYNLPTGRGKARCRGDGTPIKVAKFSGAVVFTGERSLLSQCFDKRYHGVQARLLEITLPWTTSSAHAMRLEYGCKCSYGVAAPILVKWCLEHRSDLPKAYLQQYELLRKDVGAINGIDDRVLKICSLILVAAEAFRSALQMPLDIHKIRSLLVKIHKDNVALHSNPESLYESLKGYILGNNNAFPDEESSNTSSKIYGERGNRDGRPCFWVRADVLEDFFAKNGVDDILGTLRTFHDNVWISKRSDRGFKMHKTINGVDTAVYCLYLDTPKSISTNNCKKLKNASILGIEQK